MDRIETLELLAMAAKAAGYDYRPQNGVIVMDGIPSNWNPLADDGDALRLAVYLFRDIHFWYSDNSVSVGNERRVVCGDDPCAATRLAIVRAAAEVGREMP